MFRSLQVRNYVLIDSLDIQFPEGLLIVTGQTGAGKSIIIGSISLVLGAKADASIIGEAGDTCVVEAEFDIAPDNTEARNLLEDANVEWDNGHLILRRVVSRSGRARAFVNDSPVAAGVLSALSNHLIDIHSQHQTLLLSDKKFQLSILDHYAGNTTLLEEYSQAWSMYLSMTHELEELERQISQMDTERDYVQARFAQLGDAALRDGELQELEAEQKQLANAEEIKENLYAIENLISDEGDEHVSLSTALRDCEKRLGKVSAFVPECGDLAERIASSRVEIEDILSEVKRLNSRTDVSQERLIAVESRLSTLYGLLQKFSCREISELIQIRDSLDASLNDSTALALRRDELTKALRTQSGIVNELADKLHESRVKAAPAFASAIQTSLHNLELQHSVFHTEIQDTALCAIGRDSVMFKFSASGKNAVDVAKCASGGEMSRIMLCLKDMMARYTNMPTMIFDEIDSGVSGSVADKIGSMICSMGENMQVFAITHLPQVAAKGQAHYLVSKSIDPATSQSVSSISELSRQERVMELARMLSGSTITPAAIANAKSLLGE